MLGCFFGCEAEAFLIINKCSVVFFLLSGADDDPMAKVLVECSDFLFDVFWLVFTGLDFYGDTVKTYRDDDVEAKPSKRVFNACVLAELGKEAFHAEVVV